MATFKTHALIFALFCGAGITGAKAAEPWPAECKLQREASLPFTLRHGHIVVGVQLNGVPRNFVVDTGGFLSSVTKDAAESQSLKTHLINDNIAISGIGGEKAARYAIADTMRFGNLQANDVRLVIEPDAAGEDGLIAPDYLRNFDIEIDFSQKTMNLFKPHPCTGRAVYWTDHYTTLPLNITSQGHIRVLATLDGKELEALVDTGSPATLIGARTASGGNTQAGLHRFGTLQLGNIAINNPPLLVTEDEAAWRSDNASLLLGLQELSKFHLYIAYGRSEMYLSPNLP
jgi:predicted aspartyl protease